MKKNNFITKYDDSVLNGTFETFTKPSMTEPDNAMSIPEIIARFTRGYGIDVRQHDWTVGSAFEGDNPENFWEEELRQQQQQQQQPAADPAPADPAAPGAPAADPAQADPAAKPAQEA